jgi:hypothetical protein
MSADVIAGLPGKSTSEQLLGVQPDALPITGADGNRTHPGPRRGPTPVLKTGGLTRDQPPPEGLYRSSDESGRTYGRLLSPHNEIGAGEPCPDSVP